MSLDLVDVRAKIDGLTDVWLNAKQLETGLDRSELIRKYLHDVATAEFRSATLLVNKMRDAGHIRES